MKAEEEELYVQQSSTAKQTMTWVILRNMVGFNPLEVGYNCVFVACPYIYTLPGSQGLYI